MGLWTRKTVNPAVENSQDLLELKRVLNAYDLILLGIGAIVGAGLFSITGIAAAQNAGPAIVLSFLVAASGCMLAGLCYSELASMIPISGSAYSYTYATLGELVAWVVGWTLILEYAIGAATVAISWSAYLVSLLKGFGIEFPTALTSSKWQATTLSTGEHVFGFINLPAILIVALLSWLLIIGIKESTRFNTFIVGLKLIAVALFIGVGFFFIHPANLSPFIPSNTGKFGEFGFSGILRAAGILFFAYIGFDAVSTSAQEVKNPSKNLPIGILGSLLACTLIYVLFGFVLTGVVNYKDLNVAAPVAVAIDKMPFIWLHWMVKLAILAGFTSVILVLLFGQSRIFFTMSVDKMLPSCFSILHANFRTPWITHLILMAFVGGIAGFFPIELISKMTSIGTLFAFVIVCLAVLVLRYREPHLPRPFKVPFSPFVPLAGIGMCLMMMFALEIETWVRFIAWMTVGLAIYFGYSRKRLEKAF